MAHSDGTPLTFAQRSDAAHAAGQRMQSRINSIADHYGELSLIYMLVQQGAEGAHRDLPQYTNYWAPKKGYDVIKIRRDVETKGGFLFRKGDYTIGRRETLVSTPSGRSAGWTAYSTRKHINASIKLDAAHDESNPDGVV